MEDYMLPTIRTSYDIMVSVLWSSCNEQSTTWSTWHHWH